MRSARYIIISLLPLVLFSCNNNEDTIQKETMTVSYDQATSYTVSIAGLFSNLSNNDLMYGTFMVLYGENKNGIDDAFLSWKSGNLNPECSIIYIVKINSAGEYEALITNLTPDTEYKYCLAFISDSKPERREISTIHTLKTKIFSPQIVTGQVDNVRYFDAVVSGSLMIDANDAPYCKYGIVISEHSGSDITSGKSLFFSDDYVQKYTIQVDSLCPSKEYNYKSFVSYKGTDGDVVILYGTEESFNTKSLDEMAVDLGLSVKWANCNMGDQEYNDNKSIGYAWGHLFSINGRKRLGTFMNDPEDYIYWDGNGYIDIGNEISGTEYDVAHHILGGKWRLPTKTEVEELLSCKIDCLTDEEGNAYSFIITGPNGNHIQIHGGSYWTGSLIDESRAWAFASGFIGHENQLIITDFFRRFYENEIRPVCDY